MPISLAMISKALIYARKNGLAALLARAREEWSASRRTGREPELPPAPMSVYEQLYMSLLSVSRSTSYDSQYTPLSENPPPVIDPPVKLVAFYLPQFHPIPENDSAWGRGFTEWTNVSKAIPQFVGHYQPHLPGELGFYDLRVPEVFQRQIELARLYGIHGFAFYYYWFGGRRLLDGPINRFFLDKQAKFPFCIFWANENWTRRWDGHEDDVLVGQSHTPESDADFIRDVAPYLKDDRYIRIDGKPVLMVYRVQLLPQPAATAEIWRAYCRDVGIGEIYLVAGQVYGFEDPRPAGFDAAVQFPPHNVQAPRINHLVQMLNPAYAGHVFRYEDLAAHYIQPRPAPPYDLFRTVAPNWDNEARKPGRGSTFAFSTPGKYQDWLTKACELTLAKAIDTRFVFINAWNEWGEGAHLEPDRRFGYSYLQATAAALSRLSRPA